MASTTSFSSAAGPATLPHGLQIAVEPMTIGASTANAEIVAIAAPGSTDGTLVSTTAPFPVTVIGAVPQSSVTISGGQSTSIISTASRIRIESTATLTVDNISTASRIRTESTGPVQVEDNGGSLTIDGNSTAIISSASIIRAKLAAGQSSVTIAGGQSTSIISTASKIVAELSTTGMGGSTASPIWVVPLPLSPALSTYYNGALTSTTAAVALSSAASTRFVITAVDLVNSSATAVEFSMYDGSTAGTLLYRQWCASAGGGISREFTVPRFTTTGSCVSVQILPAGNVYVTLDAFRSS